MPNPNIQLGVLNRLRASVTWPTFPQLNVTPAFLGKNGIRFARDGQATLYLPQMAGVVTSNEPYMMVTLNIDLVKTLSVAAAYEAQLQAQSTIGNGTVRPDVTTGLPAFDVYNAAIETPGELDLSGQSASYPLVIRAFFPVNNSLWP